MCVNRVRVLVLHGSWQGVLGLLESLITKVLNIPVFSYFQTLLATFRHFRHAESRRPLGALNTVSVNGKVPWIRAGFVPCILVSVRVKVPWFRSGFIPSGFINLTGLLAVRVSLGPLPQPPELVNY